MTQEEFSAVCPYLGLADDADSHATYATEAHRCYRLANPTRIAAPHQESYCLGANHVTCPVYLGEGVPGAEQRAPRSQAAMPPPEPPTVRGPKPGARQPFGGGRAPAGAAAGGGAPRPQRRQPNAGTLGPRPRAGGVSMPVATIGLFALAVVVIIRNHRVLQRYRYIAMFTGIVLLVLPMLPVIGYEQFGARLWIRLGIFSFQPGEFAKIALAVFFAGYLVEARDSLSLVGKKFLGMRFPRARDLGPILVIWAAAMAVLIVQRDLGTSLLYFGLFLVMIYVATGRLSWVTLGLLLFVGGAIIAAQLFGYVAARFHGWLDAFNPDIYSASGGSYQLVQGLFGLAHGGLIGTGLGEGRPQIVPLAESDYIIASLGEELGLAGLFAIFALYLILVSRGMRIGFAGQDDFGRLLGVGVSFVIALQIFIVVGGVTRVIPLTGLTTPFLAAGGSSLVANWVIVALLLRLSDTVRHQPRLVVGP